MVHIQEGHYQPIRKCVRCGKLRITAKPMTMRQYFESVKDLPDVCPDSDYQECALTQAINEIGAPA